MDLPDIIAAAATAWARHWAVLARVALPGAVITAAVNLALIAVVPQLPEARDPTPAELRHTLAAATPLLAAAVVVSLFTHLALVRSSLDLFRGQATDAGRAFLAAARALPAMAIVVGITLAICAALLATVFLTPLALYFLVNWMLAPQFVVDERASGLRALREARLLVRGLWWRSCAIGLSVLVLYVFPSIILAQMASATGSDTVLAVAAGVAFLIAAPFLALGHTQLYLDNRLRKGEPARPAPPRENASL